MWTTVLGIRFSRKSIAWFSIPFCLFVTQHGSQCLCSSCAPFPPGECCLLPAEQPLLPRPCRAAPADKRVITLLSQYGNRTQLKVKSVVGIWLSTQLRGTLTHTPRDWHCHTISSQGALVKKLPLIYEASSLNKSLQHQDSLQQDLKTQLLSPKPQCHKI